MKIERKHKFHSSPEHFVTRQIVRAGSFHIACISLCGATQLTLLRVHKMLNSIQCPATGTAKKNKYLISCSLWSLFRLLRMNRVSKMCLAGPIANGQHTRLTGTLSLTAVCARNVHIMYAQLTISRRKAFIIIQYRIQWPQLQNSGDGDGDDRANDAKASQYRCTHTALCTGTPFQA